MSKWQVLTQQYNDPLAWLTAEGRVFYGAEATLNGTITGPTSFATTTPTLLLDVPSGTTAIPLMVRLFQAGTVAGGAVTVLIEIDNADRYTSGGTAATVLGSRTTGAQTNAATLYSRAGSAITATDAVGVRLAGYLLGQDVSPAEGAVNEIVWTPTAGLDLVVGPGAFIVNTSAGTTGPTWYYSVKWAEIPTEWLT